MTVFMDQYKWIQSTRELLFRFCEQMTPTEYTKKQPHFGGSSIRDLHVHVANCYRSWLGGFGLQQSISDIDPAEIHNVLQMREVWKDIDTLVYAYIRAFEGQPDRLIIGEVPWSETNEELSVLWLFTHTITHEFHHKGQIVSMGRHLGYVPPDTDLIAPQEVK